jgi:hypothetical protein
MRKSDWAGPAHLKKHDYAIRGLSRALGEEKTEHEEHEQSTYDDSKFVVGDTGKLTYDTMKKFLGLQDIHKLESGELKNPNEVTPEPKTTGVPISPYSLVVKHQRMHEEKEEDEEDEFEEPDDSEFDDELSNMSEPEHVIDAYEDDELAIVDDETGEELETDDDEEDELENIPDSKKTKHGYLKDGFVVDGGVNSDDDNDDDDDDDDDSDDDSEDDNDESDTDIDDEEDVQLHE